MPARTALLPNRCHPFAAAADVRRVSVLCPTPAHLLVDHHGRPYFLWDMELALAQFQAALRTSDRETRAYLLGKRMRQAKPADVFTFVSEAEIPACGPTCSHTSAAPAPSGTGCWTPGSAQADGWNAEQPGSVLRRGQEMPRSSTKRVDSVGRSRFTPSCSQVIAQTRSNTTSRGSGRPSARGAW
jgi:hypothetical protein